MREMVLATISDQPDIEIVGEIQEDGAGCRTARRFWSFIWSVQPLPF